MKNRISMLLVLTLALLGGLSVATAQNANQQPILTGASLAGGYAINLNSSNNLTNWLSNDGSSLIMQYPGGQATNGYVFITYGPSIPPGNRPGQDMSGYQSLNIEMKGDPGSVVYVGIKDSKQPDDGTETKIPITVSANYKTYSIPLSQFVGVNLKSVYLMTEWVFLGSNPQNLEVDNVFYSSVTAQTYNFAHFAVAGGWQTTLTLINYSPQTVTCATSFYSDSGAPLQVPFSGGTSSSRTDTLLPGNSVHDQTTASVSAAVTEGWVQTTCSGPVQASLLYRLFNSSGVALGEAAVNPSTVPSSNFVTFAQTATGVAYANPSPTQPAVVTFTAISSTGARLGTSNITVGPMAHGSANIGPLLNLQNFTGFVEITSTSPIVSLSLNAEAFPVFSSMPPGDLSSTTPLY